MKEKLLRKFLKHLEKTGALSLPADQLEWAVKRFSK